MYDTPDIREIIKRSVKYLLEGAAVAFVAYLLLKNKLSTKEIIILAITAAVVFAILDTFAPTVSSGVKFGAGFGLGQALIA